MSFESYDFDNDEQWTAFLSKIELPGADQAAQLRRVQAKYYKKHVDPSFELPSTASTIPEAAQHREQPEQPDQQQQQQQDSTQPTQPPQTTSGSQPSVPTVSLLPGFNALVQAGMIGLALAFLATLVLRRPHQNHQAYQWFMKLALMSHLARIASSVGNPRLKPFSMLAIQDWLTRVTATSDSHYAMVCFMFMTQPTTLAVMVSPLLLAVLRLASYVKRSFPSVARPLLPLCNIILSKKEEAFLAMAVVDISLLVVLVVRAFTSRAILYPFIYANMLRKRYQSPVSAKYHQAVWAQAVPYAQPVLSRLPPSAKNLVDMGVSFFTGRHAPRTA